MTTKFFTTEQVEDDIGLRQRASIKLQAFHTALGEDSQIYSPDEEVGTFGLFDRQYPVKRASERRGQRTPAIPDGDPQISRRIARRIQAYCKHAPENTQRGGQGHFAKWHAHLLTQRQPQRLLLRGRRQYSERIRLFGSRSFLQMRPLPRSPTLA